MGPHAEAAQRVIGNATRRRNWTKDHPGGVIRRIAEAKAEPHHFGPWWEGVFNGRRLAEANDVRLLLDELEGLG